MELYGWVTIAVLVWLFVKACLLPLLWCVKNYRDLAPIPFPEPPPHWLLGHIPCFQPGSDESRATLWMKNNRRMYKLRIAHRIDVHPVHPETVASILKTTEPKHEGFYDYLKEWLGDGLLTSTGKRWSRDRRILTRGFHFDILRDYLPVYKEATAVMLEQWTTMSHHGDGQAINITMAAKRLTLDITLRCIMSYQSHCQTDDVRGEMREYVEAVGGISQCILDRHKSPLEQIPIIYPLTANGKKFYSLRGLLHRVTKRIITKRREELAEGERLSVHNADLTYTKKDVKYLDFLDILLTVRGDNGQELTDKEIQEQVDTFLFAGHDTTGSGLQWTLYFLAKHPELQEKCRQEVERTLDEKKEVCYEQLGQLVYLTQFIKETLRLYPPVPYFGRTLSRDLVMDGYNIPKGSGITIPPISIHRNPDVWERPLEFDPERFSAENSEKRHPFAFIPFSAGPRNCLGQSMAMDEIRTAICLILLQFRLTLDPDAAEPKTSHTLISRAMEDIKVYAHAI